MNFFKDIFCEADGSASFGRCSAGLIISFALGWGTAILCWHHSIDSANVKEILQAATWMYAANKIPTMLAGKQTP